jgi:DNA-binding HxlR family transcriptional regulator
VLTERLRTLEEKGFVFRHYEPTIPPAVTYGLAERMKDLDKIMREFDRLAEKWYREDEAAARAEGAASRVGTAELK